MASTRGGGSGARRTLLLLRHAKSSWDDRTLEDHERPLNKRGLRDAPRIGEWLRAEGLRPDLVLCSDAVRTRATLTLVLAALGGPAPRIVLEPRLYLADAAVLLAELARIEAGVHCCMMIGHNPGLQALALDLAGQGDGADLAALADKLPTAGLAVIDLDIPEWRTLRSGIGRLSRFVRPRHL